MLKTVGNPLTRYGDQTIVDGNLVIGTAGKGIDFSADPSAPGMTSELLDDYEEGSFTPEIVGSTSAGTATYSAQLGYYTKVGRVVHYNIVISYSSHTGTGNMRITGMPFTSANRNADDSWQAVCTPLNINFNRTFITGLVIPNGTRIDMYDNGNGSGGALAMDTAGVIRLTGHYEVAS